ncbi:MAG: hypothetical protein IAX21_06370 [Candidatus Bathyarchaeota archaeon]|nr:hypothetical protein [Candidatus Bathyarchaeum tardum]WGM89423.1 MAG: hypothetical protein NUK63_11060 [Candidatus Bathyarchaeum tardum]WNZ28298.1 MAG: hypothetical protein IAX21_06370 [Candidatus Bathyarchaeota archaeon]
MDAFDNLLGEALDDTLKIVLGNSVSDLIHKLTEKHLSTKITEKQNTIETKINYLEKLIGKEGTQVIQTATMKRLCLKLKNEYQEVEEHFLILDELYEMKLKMLFQLQNQKTKGSENPN